jgi:hypothetical protein
MEAALDRGEQVLDEVVYRLPASSGAFVQRVAEVLAEVEQYCRADDHLLTLAPPPGRRRLPQLVARRGAAPAGGRGADALARLRRGAPRRVTGRPTAGRSHHAAVRRGSSGGRLVGLREQVDRSPEHVRRMGEREPQPVVEGVPGPEAGTGGEADPQPFGLHHDPGGARTGQLAPQDETP